MKKINLPFIHKLSDRFFKSDAIVHPRKDWMILIVFFFILIVGALAYDGFLYQNIASGDMYISVNGSEVQSQNIDSKTLNAVVNNFEARKVEIATMKIAKLVDPSI